MDPSLENAIDCFYYIVIGHPIVPQPLTTPHSHQLVDCPSHLRLGAALTSISIIGCMLTQQDIEIDADIPAPQPQVMGAVINPQGTSVVNAPGTAPGSGTAGQPTQY